VRFPGALWQGALTGSSQKHGNVVEGMLWRMFLIGRTFWEEKWEIRN